jgi:hypothetical protein
MYQFPGGIRCERHTPFKGFYFLWNTYTHTHSLVIVRKDFASR